jgi:chitinase
VKLPANAIYFPNWRVYRGETPATLNYNCITHVYYAFANLKATGEIYVSLLPFALTLWTDMCSKLSDEWSDIQQTVDGAAGCLGSFRTLKGKYAHLKVMLSVGGEKSSNNFAAVSADAGLRECMAKSAHALLTQYDLDGIDGESFLSSYMV